MGKLGSNTSVPSTRLRALRHAGGKKSGRQEPSTTTIERYCVQLRNICNQALARCSASQPGGVYLVGSVDLDGISHVAVGREELVSRPGLELKIKSCSAKSEG